ncbi:DUF6630 family protein [Desulfovibrio litoralis]|uniref:DUF6630 domain-containing protein n=1 Tax=Desulfovibrio litoralis DSM 11393 TaxID=1121455 RepID=A0A1M7T375_9BACT|nr:hypothetical protein [Desulfovibrio litoralis]SHN65151.1 hypothetical protein SAMN02745728_01497 [Desulfovibrio litoralis DSM 11393]
MSNIYYSERKLASRSEKFYLNFWIVFYRILGFLRPCTWKSKTITTENINKLLSLPAVFLSVNPCLAPFNTFAIRSQEMWYEHADLGKVFIPRNIMLSNAQHIHEATELCYIVQIDNEFELRSWPGINMRVDAPDKKTTYPVTMKSAQIKAEKSFEALLIRNGILPAPEGENRYFELEGTWSILEENGGTKRPKLPVYIKFAGRENPTPKTPLKEEDIRHFLSLLQAQLPEKNIADILEAANTPDEFFDNNYEYLEEYGFDKPESNMYWHIFLNTLIKKDILHYLEHNEPKEEIAAHLSEMIRDKNLGLSEKYDKINEGEEGFDEEELTSDVLLNFENELKEHGLALLNIDTEGDYYAVFIVPIEDVEAVTTVAKHCGFTVLLPSQS